jgi:cell division protein FtsW
MGSMLGVFPLTGLPLLFISHGGTAMFFALGSVGLILNISKYLKA